MKKISFLFTSSFLFIAIALNSCNEETQTLGPANENLSVISTNDFLTKHENIVRVAPPTGDPSKDRASIEDAVARAERGNVILFNKGTYVIGSGVTFNGVEIDVPHVTLLGHKNGTTLKGGDNITFFGEFEGLILTGGNQVVRNFTFESFSGAALNLNPVNSFFSEESGYVIENNNFKYCVYGIVYFGLSDEISYIHYNNFDNVGSAFIIFGKTAHVKHNIITSSDPQNVPLFGQPFNVGGALAFVGPSENNVFAFNTIEGIADGIILQNFPLNSDAACRNNHIYANKFIQQKVFTEIDLGTMVWLENVEGFPYENNQVFSNTLMGTEGIGIYSSGGTNTVITKNTILNVRENPQAFIQPTGVGIYIDGASAENKLMNNRFANNELYDIALFGDHNLVVTKSPHDKVHNEGANNTVLGIPSRKLLNKNEVSLKSISEVAKKKMDIMHEYLNIYIDQLKVP